MANHITLQRRNDSTGLYETYTYVGTFNVSLQEDLARETARVVVEQAGEIEGFPYTMGNKEAYRLFLSNLSK